MYRMGIWIRMMMRGIPFLVMDGLKECGRISDFSLDQKGPGMVHRTSEQCESCSEWLSWGGFYVRVLKMDVILYHLVSVRSVFLGRICNGGDRWIASLLCTEHTIVTQNTGTFSEVRAARRRFGEIFQHENQLFVASTCYVPSKA